MKKSAAKSMVISLGAFVFAHFSLLAETPNGKIETFVTDRSAAAVTKAKVTATNRDTGLEKPCTTSEDGSCPIAELPAGEYDVEVRSPGFKIVKQLRVLVSSSKTTRVDVKLEPGQFAETVTVEANAVAVQTEDVTRIQVVAFQLKNQTEAIAFHAPELSLGMTESVSLPFLAMSGFVSVNGNRPSTNNFLVDGTSLKSSYSNSASTSQPGVWRADSLPIGAVAEATVLTDVGADYGDSSGAIFSTTLKRGTNDIHFGAFELFGNDALNTRDFFNISGPKNKTRFNDYGGELGGPLKKTQVFGLVAYEGHRDFVDSTTLLAVPTAADFASAIVALGGNPTIPVQQNPIVNPVIRNLFSLCAANAKCPGGISLWPKPLPQLSTQVLNSSPQAPASHQFDSAHLALDFFFTEKSKLAAHTGFSTGSESLPLALEDTDPQPRTNTIEQLGTNIGVISYQRVLSVTSDDYARLSWITYSVTSLDSDMMGIGNPNSSIGLNTGTLDAHDFGLPELRVSGFSSLGASPYSNPSGRKEITWQAVDQFSHRAGRHELKSGYEFRHNRIRSFNDCDHRGVLNFNSLEAFLAGQVSRGSLTVGDSRRLALQNSHAAYFADNYLRSTSLSVNLGLRWEYFGVVHEENRFFSKYSPKLGLNNPTEIYSRDFNDFAPRAGIAWNLKSQTVIRVGGGIYYSAIPADVFLGEIQFNTLNPGVAYNALSSKPILTSHSPISLLQVGVPVFPQSTFASDPQDVWTIGAIRTPYVFNYGLNIQQQLFAKTIVEVAYVGSSARKLLRVRDINAPIVPGGIRPLSTAAPVSAAALSTPFVVNQLETSASSHFNSLQSTWKQQSWHGWENYVVWTWSHSIDDASSAFDWTPRMSLANNASSPTADRASSNFDQRHSFAWQSIYEFHQSHILGLLRGWRLSGFLSLRSGQPFDVNFADEFDTTGAYDFITRPDLVGKPFVATSTPHRLLNLAAFHVPCTLDGLGTTVSHCLPGTMHFGNLRRNSFVGPNRKEISLSVSRTFKLWESLNLNLEAEALNLTNHPIFANPVLPQHIARASQKGIGFSGVAGSAGSGCNTAAASSDCYLSDTATADNANSFPSQGEGGRTIRITAKITF